MQQLQPPRAVGILGGMGPAAGADFVRLFVQACTDHLRHQGQPVHDQAYPEHWLVQLPMPDRTQALRQDPQSPLGPAQHLLQGVGRMAALGVRSVALACNTAHAWHGQLQALFPQLHVLHIARQAAQHLQAAGARQAIVLATAGTYDSGLYDEALMACGIAPLLPDAAGRARLMQGIYEGVKQGDMALAAQRFGQVLAPLLQRHGDVPVLMACTEIPLALPQAREAHGATLVDPAWILAQALAGDAYGPVMAQ
ncbi:aspartate/glutamate racemase family protein [Delftia sp. PS-11]|uniref:aspartate/glutamate racemase family protein n=1 Tax=Delftia sp. PS-11 TaxID=2767222 RepID=UPI0024566DDC|nr:amino acid racemase [Delftia sp. PS-11]KAJ8745610.1 aspartate/glutamate racemase family protein [Delftia sp. PS-11]